MKRYTAYPFFVNRTLSRCDSHQHYQRKRCGNRQGYLVLKIFDVFRLFR